MTNLTQYCFRLYVAGDGPHSNKATANLKAICRDHLEGRCEIEIIDVFKEPRRAVEDQVMLTPLLVKVSPSPSRKLVGTLNNRQAVLQALGIEVGTESE